MENTNIYEVEAKLNSYNAWATASIIDVDFTSDKQFEIDLGNS